MSKNKWPVPLECEEQEALFEWAAWQSGAYPELNLLFHIPNGRGRSKAEAGRLKVEGVKSGVPDLLLPVARRGQHGLFIEMKRQRGGGPSEKQTWWHDALSRQGYAVAVCRGWQEASRVMIDYLKGKDD